MTWSLPGRTSTAISATRRTPRTTSSTSIAPSTTATVIRILRPRPASRTMSVTTSAAIRGATSPITSGPRRRRSRHGSRPRAAPTAAGRGWLAPSTARTRATAISTATFADYADYAVVPVLQLLQYTYLAPLDPTESGFSGATTRELDETAVFGELSFDLTENFTITGGGRWFDYDRKFAQIQEQPEGRRAPCSTSNPKTSEDGTVGSSTSPTASTPTALVYATYSEGFRVGGSNPLKAASTLPQNYKSDELDNYEIGAKTEWLDNRLRVNLAAYYMKWNDIQVQVEDPQPVVPARLRQFPHRRDQGRGRRFRRQLQRAVAARRHLLLEQRRDLASVDAHRPRTTTAIRVRVSRWTKAPACR